MPAFWPTLLTGVHPAKAANKLPDPGPGGQLDGVIKR